MILKANCHAPQCKDPEQILVCHVHLQTDILRCEIPMALLSSKGGSMRTNSSVANPNPEPDPKLLAGSGSDPEPKKRHGDEGG